MHVVPCPEHVCNALQGGGESPEPSAQLSSAPTAPASLFSSQAEVCMTALQTKTSSQASRMTDKNTDEHTWPRFLRSHTEQLLEALGEYKDM